ncbi:hypothetical protein GCM10027073_42200 [Streptomyces chlorus]|uniref:Uncharacterized protein n=1 Tax=Streptomyces chlorus TaxID=887452 RepID=A0ABW1E5Y4_9ACTN
MEETSGDDVESCHYTHYSTPSSQRELISLHLECSLARTGAEKKDILNGAGMTPEELGEHFGMGSSGISDHDS